MKRKITPVFSISVFESIRQTVGSLPAESGGMLCGCRKTGVITFFHFDKHATCSSATYVPDTNTLNKLLPQLNAQGLDLMGFVHSHPHQCTSPSTGDEFYCSKIFSANPDLSFFIIPIVDPMVQDRQFCMRVFVATQKGKKIKVERIPLQILEMETPAPELNLSQEPNATPAADIPPVVAESTDEIRTTKE